ncbi:hypothetical protein GGS24DRAFT_44211 [Hypoxylon argillaceum]|nr:hypothetical protein GGS24DRAFT_44211 [Hypoxylon argillaceum]
MIYSTRTHRLVGLLRQAPDLRGRTGTVLVSQFGPPLGQFLAALAKLILDNDTHTERDKKREGHVSSSPQDQPAPKRNRIVVKHPDMIDNTQMRVVSSSPTQPSSQTSSRDDAFVPDDADSLAREANTERLLTCFLRCILYSIPCSKWEMLDRLECRAPIATTMQLTPVY